MSETISETIFAQNNHRFTHETMHETIFQNTNQPFDINKERMKRNEETIFSSEKSFRFTSFLRGPQMKKAKR